MLMFKTIFTLNYLFTQTLSNHWLNIYWVSTLHYTPVCVCVREREREKDKWAITNLYGFTVKEV